MKIPIALIAAVLITALIIAGCTAKSPASGQAAPPVQILQPQEQPKQEPQLESQSPGDTLQEDDVYKDNLEGALQELDELE